MLGEADALTSALLWRATFAAAAIDLPLLALAGRGVSRETFAALKWALAAAACFVYASLWAFFGAAYFWDTVYAAVFPAWARWWLPPWFGALYGAAALLSWRVSLLPHRWPAVWFVLCGGAISLLGHGIGISRGLLRVPLLEQVSAASALAFGVFEFIFYWCVIVGLALAGHAAWRSARHR